MTTIAGPYFEDFQPGQVFNDAPSITLTEGFAAIHQALFADRLRLPLDHHLSASITGEKTALANPSLVCNTAIGQTTYASTRVKGNLFYRGLIFKKPVFLGDTLTTTTKVVALKQNKIKEGRAATGMVVLDMQVHNQHGDEIIHFWRCPMIPCRDPQADTGHNDNFDAIPAMLDSASLLAAIPQWNYADFRKLPGKHFADYAADEQYTVESQDTVTLAPELVRLTLNMAQTHTDASASAYGKRLVYGGHTISMAAAQLTRALPNMLTIVGWRSCDHTAPVFEEDILQTRFTINNTQAADDCGLLDLHVEVFATRGPHAPTPGSDIKVLDWKPIVLLA